MVWELCGMARSEAGLKSLLTKVPELREQFWSGVSVLGTGESLNQSLEKAGRVADFLEMAELLARDALDRKESCGGSLPRREPDRRRRGQARRPKLPIRGGLGVSRQRQGADRARAAQRGLELIRQAQQRSYK